MINADKPHLWKADVVASVDMYNAWFVQFAPLAYRRTRATTAQHVVSAMSHTADFANITPNDLRQQPSVLQTLRMSTAPPIARDRLAGLANVSRGLVETLEAGNLPPRTNSATLNASLQSICSIIDKLLDRDLFVWMGTGQAATQQERERAASVVADRLCGAVSDPIVRNEQEKRQLAEIEVYLTGLGYVKQAHPSGQPLTAMQPGTFAFRMVVVAGAATTPVNIPVDVVIQPKVPKPSGFPLLIEAKSAGDYANTNKRRKEESDKMKNLRDRYGADANLTLFLCGYFDAAYLGYEAAEGIDWVWEHRIADLDQLGL